MEATPSDWNNLIYILYNILQIRIHLYAFSKHNKYGKRDNIFLQKKVLFLKLVGLSFESFDWT